MTDDPGTFLLGVGAQKGGTSWLHDYLQASPQFDPGFRKEYHVFDGLDLPHSSYVRERVLRQAERARLAREAGEPYDEGRLLRASFYTDPGAYPDYFAGLLRAPGTRLTADVTPSYALLGEERLASVRRSFEERGVRCVAVFLMRDPVDRVWSSVRMSYDRGRGTEGRTAEERTLEVHRQDYHRLRSRYDLTLDRLDAAFAPGLVHLELYERLFRPEAVEELCGFLCIDAHPAQVGKRVNATPTDAVLPEATVREVAATYAPVYDAVARRFPDVDLERLWPSARFR
ncbi:sulfotransferase [Nocardioides sp. NPDC092400]|uniref:sulfotransferase n=1 Tax=Nocardioides sp. NPDC092400 TaxID=3155196 RepID=UPI0034487DF0